MSAVRNVMEEENKIYIQSGDQIKIISQLIPHLQYREQAAKKLLAARRLTDPRLAEELRSLIEWCNKEIAVILAL